MYAKVFSQIYDSSIVEQPEVRFTFIDFLILADQNGVVDMTHEAIARRTNRPLQVIQETVAELEADDPRSRSPDCNGARIKRLDDHRDWGWMIVNYDSFRQIASAEQKREKTLARVRKYRESRNLQDGNALKRDVTPANACNAKHKHKQMHKQIEEFVVLWNDRAPTKIAKLTDKRKEALSTRLKDSYFRENYAAALEKVKRSAFCNGGGRDGWKADVEWFLRPDTVVKIMEGKYDGKNSQVAVRVAISEQEWNEFLDAHPDDKWNAGLTFSAAPEHLRNKCLKWRRSRAK